MIEQIANSKNLTAGQKRKAYELATTIILTEAEARSWVFCGTHRCRTGYLTVAERLKRKTAMTKEKPPSRAGVPKTAFAPTKEQVQEALNVLYASAMLEEGAQEFAANHPNTKMNIHAVVVMKVVASDTCVTMREYDGYELKSD